MLIPFRKTRRISPEQVGGVESPATVLLVPVQIGRDINWWTHDGILLGGVKVNSVKTVGEKGHITHVSYLPLPVPRSWVSDFRIVVEYGTDDDTADFQFQLYYACGDPHQACRMGKTDFFKGKSVGKQRLNFRLKKEHINKNELFRATLAVLRKTPDPVYIYGTWLEVGVD